MSTRPDPYVVLGVSREASIAEIREAYRQRMRELHPDRGGPDDLVAHAEIAAVNEAWSVLRSVAGDTRRGFEGAPEEQYWGAPPAEAEALVLDGGPVPRKLRTVLMVTIVLLVVWTAVFVVIAFSQSG